MQGMSNPFTDDGEVMVTLDTKLVMDHSVVQTLRTVEQLGKTQYSKFVEERLVRCEKPLSDTIQKNNLALFGTPKEHIPGRDSHQVASLKANCAILSHLYISCQSRSGNLTEFFAHENHTCTPSLSDMGNLRHGKESDLVPCLQTTKPDKVIPDSNPVAEAVLDGAALVHMLPPKDVKTNFSEYAKCIFMPYIRRRLQIVQRLDVVWDCYIKDSLKQSTRESRGTGQCRRVLATTPLPTNWQ